MPFIAFNGVLNSWLTVDKNSALALEACSALIFSLVSSLFFSFSNLFVLILILLFLYNDKLKSDKIEIKDGQISVNGQKLAESYASTEGYVTDQSEVVPAGKVWVMGDNRRTGASLDSRAYGAVDLRDVAGTANLRLWPDAGLLPR